ncbi:MAG TPA: hypothetical protein VHF25_05470 [Nitriliruptorales bacterium]|nr:hypothetical protein [Nitriliruptorales bacterium]
MARSAMWHARGTGGARPRARLRRAVGAAASAACMVAAGVAPGAAAAAQEPTTEPAAITREAYFTQSAGASVPDTLVSEFPPGVVCVLRPEACAEQSDPVRAPVNDALRDHPPEQTVPAGPGQPVAPDTLPTGLLGGQPRYASYLHFELPAIPEGHDLVAFELVLQQAGVNYRTDSPTFREAVEAVVLAAGTRDQEIVERELREALESERLRAGEEAPYGVEACMALGEWQEGDDQEWSAQPETDCIVLASTGTRDAETGTWTFDLTWIVQAWLDGQPNRGLYLGPVAAPNLAFGDRDTSTNAQVSFGGADAGGSAPTIRYAVVAASEATGSVGGPVPAGAGPAGPLAGGVSSGGVPGPAGGLSVPSFGQEPAPTIAGPGTAPRSGVPPQVAAPATHASVPAASGQPITPWYVWLLLPAGLGAAFVLARSLTAEPVAVVERPGAMSRLIERRSAGSAATSPRSPV